MVDIADRAGVSQSLVSIVMRGVPGAGAETRERILAVAHELGYRPDIRAQMLRRNSSRLLGVTFHTQHDFHGDLIAALYRAVAPLDYQLALSAVTPDRDEGAAVDDLLSDRCEALILLGPGAQRAALHRLAGTLPVIAVARSVRLPAVDVVRSAEAHGVHRAVDHLVDLGHRRIAHIDGGRAPGAPERRRGYRDAMTRHGLADEIVVVTGGPTEDDGAAAARTLLQSAAPTGVIVFNDAGATGVLEVLRREGLRVPDDVSVVGYDDSRMARMSFIDLTTIAQDADRLAELAVARAIERATGAEPSGSREQIVVPALVVRSTTAPPTRTSPAAPRGRRHR
jgi:DNA-binding LacI/PurR family transcriptional regulator